MTKRQQFDARRRDERAFLRVASRLASNVAGAAYAGFITLAGAVCMLGFGLLMGLMNSPIGG